MSKLQILPPNKNRTFTTKFYPNLVRTGVIADGSCFFHSVCYALFEDYRKLSLMDKSVYVKEIRNKIVEEMTLDAFKSFGDLFRVQYIMNLRNLIEKCAPLTQKYSFDYWDNKVLTELSMKWQDTDLSNAIKIIQPLLHSNTIEDSDTIEKIFNISEKITFKMFQKHLKHDWVDEFGMELISKYFRCNFYFFSFDTHLPYNTSISNQTFRKNIILLWIDNSHYESIGELYEEKKVKRVFTNRSAIITKFREYLKIQI